MAEQAAPAALQVLFPHVADAELWGRTVESLEALAGRCEAGDLACASDLASAVREVRVLNGCDNNRLGALAKAADAAEAEGICALRHLTGPVAAFLARLACQLPALFPEGLPLLTQDRSGQVLLTRRQCAALLAAGAFGLLPGPAVRGLRGEGGRELEMPDFDMDFVLDSDYQKALCLLCYFVQLASAEARVMEEKVSFARRSEEPLAEDFWRQCDQPLRSAKVLEGAIEGSHADLQADFANEYLGGGVLHGGNVQEEIRFSISPECLVGMLFCEKMLYNEAIFVVGTRQFSRYGGYGSSFRFAGPFTEEPVQMPDELGRRGPHIVALDALVFPGKTQYEEPLIRRELQKAYVACLGDPAEAAGERRPAFATGNWGCGVFGGDPQIKALIQWLAASVAGRDLAYFPYGDNRVAELAAVFEAISARGMSCGNLYGLLQGHQPGGVFARVREKLAAGGPGAA